MIDLSNGTHWTQITSCPSRILHARLKAPCTWRRCFSPVSFVVQPSGEMLFTIMLMQVEWCTPISSTLVARCFPIAQWASWGRWIHDHPTLKHVWELHLLSSATADGIIDPNFTAAQPDMWNCSHHSGRIKNLPAFQFALSCWLSDSAAQKQMSRIRIVHSPILLWPVSDLTWGGMFTPISPLTYQKLVWQCNCELQSTTPLLSCNGVWQPQLGFSWEGKPSWGSGWTPNSLCTSPGCSPPTLGTHKPQMYSYQRLWIYTSLRKMSKKMFFQL